MNDDVLVKVENVSKKFCRSLKRSLWYGVQDMLSELNPFSHRSIGTPYPHDSASDCLRPDEFWAVKDVSFELRRGECLGLIGRNGAGKTTLLKMLNGLIKPDQGRITVRGQVGALIALGAGFNPILTGRENIYVNGSVLGLTKKEIDDKIEEIIDLAEVRDFIDTPVQSYSSGMQVRLGFSVATALEPDVLLLDEVLAVGDAFFRAKCFARIGHILSRCAVIFVSHNEAQVARICNRALLLKSGAPVFWGEPTEALRLYRNQQERVYSSFELIKDHRVIDFSLCEKPNVVTWGGSLELKLQLRLAEDIYVRRVYIHWGRNGEFVANSELRYDDVGPLHLHPGTHILTATISDIRLVHGVYLLSFSMFDETGKATILHALDMFAVHVQGPVGSGPATLLPLTLKLLDRTVKS
jgi:homopolymeric O-antigen transport system ATP-binding protein